MHILMWKLSCIDFIVFILGMECIFFNNMLNWMAVGEMAGHYTTASFWKRCDAFQVNYTCEQNLKSVSRPTHLGNIVNDLPEAVSGDNKCLQGRKEQKLKMAMSLTNSTMTYWNGRCLGHFPGSLLHVHMLHWGGKGMNTYVHWNSGWPQWLFWLISYQDS